MTALRADAARNRERVLEAARDAFREHGLDVPIEEIATRAGVGVATLYRRFPTRDALVAAAFEPKMELYAQAVEDALADPDPWNGFRRYVERVCAMQAADHGFTDVLTRTFPTAPELEAHRDRSYRRFVLLVRRAKRAGRLRADFVPEDLPLILMAHAGVVAAAGRHAPGAGPRLVGLLLAALDAAPVDHPDHLPPPPSPQEMLSAMEHAGRPT